MLAYWSTVSPFFSHGQRNRFSCKSDDLQTPTAVPQPKKRAVVIGSGWAGLGAAHHLCKQGLDVTVLEGGYESELSRITSSPDEFGMRGFSYPYRNIFALVEELGIKPFTNWTTSAQYSADGLLEVKFPVLQDLPQWPTPLGTLLYTQFARLDLLDRLTSLPLMAAVVDFDNTDDAWRRYDSITARELFKQFGCSEKLYSSVLDPLLQVGLFAPAEQCSAAATLGMLYYFVLAHQKDFDFVWTRGTVKEKIFDPWIDNLKGKGCKFLNGRRVTDFGYNDETGSISEVVCGKESLKADAVVLAVGIGMLQEIVKSSAVLSRREEFLKVLNLSCTDLLTVKLQLDKKVNIPNASNACSGQDDDSYAWTFFDLNKIYDDYKEEESSFIQADFFNANELLPLKDEDIASKALSCLSKCIKGIDGATIIDKEIGRFPRSLTRYFPGSYKYMMRGTTSFSNMFMAGDWIMSRHGSWLQEKSYVMGIEAANRVVDYLEEGNFAKIMPVEEDESHIQYLRSLSRSFSDLKLQLPWSDFFIQ
ncbi:uncharacterized protein LOC124913991 [Impatiens glandulifera]|uniref:uncharacterized protein LOC124913991 n=1 Tax=Impatiens glandulifera TaxID=253017 RepID=UPI001FB09C5F|nr:uncharacterized protein LOC124913991 [Impatiens glandulifera]